jgi:hypothetical protein
MLQSLLNNFNNVSEMQEVSFGTTSKCAISAQLQR